VNQAVVENLSERAALPIGVHRVPETRERLIHSLARLELAGNDEARVTYGEFTSPCVSERESAHEEIRPTHGGRDVAAQLSREPLPHLPLD